MSSFTGQLNWSLSPSNTTTAVRLLSGVWPDASWVTTVTSTDCAGVDLLGNRDGRPPIRVDLKVRRLNPVFFDAHDPDCAIDIGYASSDGQKRFGPLLRGGPLAADHYLYVWPQADPPVGVLLNVRRAQPWIQTYHPGLRNYTSATEMSDGLSWVSTFCAPPASIFNICVGSGVARVLTITEDGDVRISAPID